MTQPLLKLDDRFNWDLLLRQTYTATRRETGGFNRIPPVSLTTESNILLAGSRNTKGSPNWYTGAYLNPCLLASPSSTTEFVSLMQFGGYRVPLSRLALFQMPKYLPVPYLLYFTIPRWHEELFLEVWEYIGPETTTVEQALLELPQIQDLARIEAKIDNS